ncbi:MAG TPA: hypothetical protein VFT74_18935 [Isosphaeraceae bacterium]|nr:hypothetical protein [Isosphaeraceae bacterium]
MSIAKKAVTDSKDVARLAVDAAKNELIEQLNPAIQAIIEAQLRKGALGEDVDRLRRAEDGYGETEFEEGKEMKKDKKDKMESVAALFPGVNEVADDVAEGEDVAEAEELPESEDVYEGDEPEVDEAIEISESELAAMYAEALQLEVDVSKGFKDMAKPHEFGAGAKGQYQSDGANLADYKNGEHQWDDEEPPAKKDWTVKEIRKLVRQGMAENAALSEHNAKLTEMVKALHGKLSEMNLLNSKILHVNKFMAAHRLTAEQKRTVIESIDQGSTVKEVKSIYGILENSFKAAGAVNESTARNKPRADSQKRRTSGAPDTRVLRESADKAEGGGFGRWQQLAGIVNGK